MLERLEATIRTDLAASNVAGDLDDLAASAARLLTCRDEHVLPSFTYRVEALTKLIHPNANIAAELRACAHRQSLNQADPITPYHLRMTQLDGMLYGRDVSGFNLRQFFAQVGLKLADVAFHVGTSSVVGSVAQGLGAGAAVAGIGVGERFHSAGQRVVAEARTGLLDSEASRRARMTNILQSIKRIYAPEVALLPAAFQRRISRIDDQAESAIRSGQTETFDTLMRRRQGPLLSRPVYVKRLLAGPKSDHEHRQLCDQIDQDVECLLERYGHISELRSVVNAIRGNSITTSPPQRAQYYLLGSPGVGKSHFVEEIARVLRLPFIKIMLSCQENLEALRRNPSLTPEYMLLQRDARAVDMCGLVQFSIIEHGLGNPIVFFDEAGDVVSRIGQAQRGFGDADAMLNTAAAASLKELLDQRTKTLPLGAFKGLDIDFTHPTVFLAGNEPIANAALASRLPCLRFPDLTRQQKHMIAGLAVESAVRQYPDLEAGQQAAVIAQARCLLPGLMDEHEALYPIPGVRAAEGAARAVVAACAIASLAGTPVDAQEVHDAVATCYRTALQEVQSPSLPAGAAAGLVGR